jgi:hypothetical protein
MSAGQVKSGTGSKHDDLTAALIRSERVNNGGDAVTPFTLPRHTLIRADFNG